MEKKLIKLAVVLILLGGLGAYLKFTRTSGFNITRPLEKADLSKVSKISIKNMYGTVELQKVPTGWSMVQPVRDVADSSIPDDIVSALKDFSVESIISENPSKYSQFMIDDANAVHFRIYSEGQTAPLLDGYVGKATADYDKCYFRFQVSTPVYIVSGFPHYSLQREINGFRKSDLLPFKKDQLTAFEIKVPGEKLSFDFVKSSDTWLPKSGGAPVPDASMAPFLTKMEGLVAADFITEKGTPASMGLDKPYLTVKVEVGGTPVSLVVGTKASPSFPSAPETRYVKSDGRDVVMTVRVNLLQDLVSSLKTLPR